jgi:phospholipid N-methyltransferase
MIQQEVLNVLSKCRLEGGTVFLPPGQLDRKLYENVNKCLEGIGGKWNRKARGHVFDNDPTDLFENMVMTGEAINIKKDYQFFPTPESVVTRMIQESGLHTREGERPDILEPSAGKGAIVVQATKYGKVRGVELNKDFARHLTDNFPGVEVVESDFLAIEPKMEFDYVLMNPPFTKQQDVDHIIHAFRFLKHGGTMVAICSESPFFRENEKSVDFRAWLNDLGADATKLDDDAFRESGTGVRTRIITIRKEN